MLVNLLKRIIFMVGAVLSVAMTCSQVCFSICPVRTIDVTELRVEYTGGCHSNVMVIYDGDKVKYFKESKIRLSIRDEVRRTIDDYFFEVLCDEKFFHDRLKILDWLEDGKNFEKFIGMGKRSDKNSLLFRFLNDSADIEDFGLRAGLSIDMKNFLVYVSRELCQYRIHEGTRVLERQDQMAKNELATVELAKLLGISDMVAGVEYVELVCEGKRNKVGLLIDAAKGVRWSNLKKFGFKAISPIFQAKMNILEVFDFICMDTDHSVWNMCVEVSQDGIVTGFMVFDNDNSFDLSTDLKCGFWHAEAPILTCDDCINLPHLSKEFAETLFCVDLKKIEGALENLLSSEQIKALCIRIRAIQNALRKTSDINDDFLISLQEYSNQSIDRELHGDYGSTYLFAFFLKK